MDQSLIIANEINKQKKGKIISDENDEIIRINFNSYKRYFMKYYGGWSFIILS